MCSAISNQIQGGLVSSREDVDAALRVFSAPAGNADPDDKERVSIVYINCAGFLRVRKTYFLHDQRSIIGTWLCSWRYMTGGADFPHPDPLDDTRIHPIDYGIATQMASDALDEEDDFDGSQVEAVIRRPHLLEDIGTPQLGLIAQAHMADCHVSTDLDSFAEEWERSGKGKKAIALQDIRKELGNPYADPRDSYREPSNDQLFYLLSGETESTLKYVIYFELKATCQNLIFSAGLGSWCTQRSSV